MSSPRTTTATTRNKQAEAFRVHYNRALAELVWCNKRVSELRQSKKISKATDIRVLCGKHWVQMWKEWASAARLLRRRAREEVRTGHVVVAAILRGVADKLTLPSSHALQSLDEARELLAWIPNDRTPIEESQYWAVETVTNLPVLRPSAKRDLIGQVLSKAGRPSDTRRVAAYAMEMHLLGKSWSQIEKKLVSHRKNVSNSGMSVRREVQLLKTVLKRHNIQT